MKIFDFHECVSFFKFHVCPGGNTNTILLHLHVYINGGEMIQDMGYCGHRMSGQVNKEEANAPYKP